MKKKLILVFLLLGILSVLMIRPIHADPIPNINIQVGNNNDGSSGGASGGTSSISILLLTTVLSVAPAFLMLMTSFTRIVIVLGFVRTSLGTQQMPPNQVLVGLALFLTLFIMSPTLATVNETALQPYIKGTITQTEALNKAADPMKEFMFKQTSTKDLLLFMNYTSKNSTTTKPANYSEIPLTVMVPAFAIGEMKKAFTMGFLIFIPFLIIDIVVASTLMAMGMMMLPPVMISLPFKIMLFVLVDGWYLVIKSLLLSFNP
ncbi:flagellar type III secretion system pore protein FliP [Paenibacillus sp. 19GGS1-52]|uniref:flagellar type III secretion system pore protein FliP n=1 Tax=Paenibacillus sp. 19GGS1-52 TaxID=2758563 RepID=UPI001EFC291F|nr:flagellar type III secretion system pore protein FliP [Paenibacillus sp. 19GGS1-52]ULO09713.1 flagellar type III secretion system pore protein FliP [Paenibacillus sp. 19GGS1-52]